MATADGPQVLDSRGVGKVLTFSERREDLKEWIPPFESCCGLLGWAELIEGARDHDGPIGFDGLGSGVAPLIAVTPVVIVSSPASTPFRCHFATAFVTCCSAAGSDLPPPPLRMMFCDQCQVQQCNTTLR